MSEDDRGCSQVAGVAKVNLAIDRILRHWLKAGILLGPHLERHVDRADRMEDSFRLQRSTPSAVL